MMYFLNFIVFSTLFIITAQSMVFDTPRNIKIKIEDNEEKNCKCGFFEKHEKYQTGEPFMIHAPIRQTCDVKGEITCRTMCRNVGNYIRGDQNGQKIMCSKIKNSDKPVISSTFFKLCDSKWAFIELNYKKLLKSCCKNGKVVPCK